MQGDLNRSQEVSVLTLLAKITSITDFNDLLNAIVQDVPSVVGAVGCWVYLRPEFVPQYSGILSRAEKEIKDLDLNQEYIVLAATNLDSKKSLIGKAFFTDGEGITGWVYKHGRPLRINNLVDDKGLESISPNLYWSNEYHDGDELYAPQDKRHLMVVPLILGDRSIGTLKFHATIDKYPFSEISQEIALIVSQIIAGALRQTWMVAEQSQTISRLIETSNKKTPYEVIVDITGSMREMLNYSRVEFFLKNETNKVHLIARNGELVSDFVEYERGQSLVGWVFKTGLPLLITDIGQFSTGKILSDEILEKISNTREVNEDDRFLESKEDISYYTRNNKLQNISFLAVPVISKEQDVQGVLCGHWVSNAKIKLLYESSQLMLASSFASTISLALENERQRELSNLLIKIGQISEYERLLQLVTEELPQLASASGCSIFEVFSKQGIPSLKLTYTSRNDQSLDKGIPEIHYEIGQGKTGIAALTQTTFINHYGKGDVTHKKLLLDKYKMESRYPKDLVQLIQDNEGNDVGFIQLRNSLDLSARQKEIVSDFSKNMIFGQKGIISSKLTQYTEVIPAATWSHVAVPLFSEHRLIGVITLYRSMPESPFSLGDINLVESIAGRLESVLNNLDVNEQRKQLLISLAHEITTPLTGIMADSENLYQELGGNPELQNIAKHNLEQVQRLQFQTSTIFSFLTNRPPIRKFDEHNIFRPLREACELFETEAAQNGCEILGPKAIDGEMPVIEMSLFELTIAFKNLIHNAVKYSFSPPEDQEKSRFINIWTLWDKTKKNYLINIQNYGVGIMPTEVEKRLIFEPFYRGEKASERKRTGTGFGLAYARQVIEDIHHGNIAVKSISQGRDGYLTTFTISLPKRQR